MKPNSSQSEQTKWLDAPCPFCGAVHRVDVVPIKTTNPAVVLYGATCTRCGATGPTGSSATEAAVAWTARLGPLQLHEMENNEPFLERPSFRKSTNRLGDPRFWTPEKLPDCKS